MKIKQGNAPELRLVSEFVIEHHHLQPVYLVVRRLSKKYEAPSSRSGLILYGCDRACSERKIQIFETFLRAARRVAFGVVLLSLIASAATGVIAVWNPSAFIDTRIKAVGTLLIILFAALFNVAAWEIWFRVHSRDFVTACLRRPKSNGRPCSSEGTKATYWLKMLQHTESLM